MKCRKCAAESEVLETRKSAPWLRRTRLCFNGHRFVTYEVYPGNIDRRTRVSTVNGIAAAALARKRKHVVANSTAKLAVQLARELGVTEARVRQIKKELGQARPSSR